MLVNIQGSSLEWTNQMESVEALFQKIDEIVMEQPDLVLSHITINGENIYDSYREFIEEQLDQIKLIDVHFCTFEELFYESLVSADKYIREALPQIKHLANDFYQNDVEESWGKLERLLEGVQWIHNLVKQADQHQQLKITFHKFIDTYIEHSSAMASLQEALENSDLILIGDILQYEMVPLFESMAAVINEMIDNGVVRNDLN